MSNPTDDMLLVPRALLRDLEANIRSGISDAYRRRDSSALARLRLLLERLRASVEDGEMLAQLAPRDTAAPRTKKRPITEMS